MPQLNTVNAIDYALIAFYFAIVIWVGFYAARKNRGTKDFFQAGGQVPWFMAGTANWIAGFTAYMFVAAASVTYSTGTSALLIFTSAFWAYLGGRFIFAPLWRRARLQAPLDFLTRRYSPATNYFYTVTAIPLQIVQIGTTLYTICVFVSTALGLERTTLQLGAFSLSGLQVCILVLGAIVIVYSMVGGLWAAVLSDSMQGVVITTMSLIILPLSLRYAGHGGLLAGLSRLTHELPGDYIGFNRNSKYGDPLFLAASIGVNFLIYNVFWHQAQRYNSVPSEKDAKKMATLCAWLSLFGPLLWVLPVMTAKLIFPDMAALWPNLKEPSEASFVSVALLLLPHGMIGFVVAAIISTSLGYANDTFNWLASSVTKDIYSPLRKKLGLPGASERHQMRAAQLIITGIGVAGVGVAFLVPRAGGVFSFTLYYSSLTLCSFLTPVALGLLYRKTPWWSGIASCCGGLVLSIGFMLLGVYPAHNGYERNAFAAAGGSAFVFFLSTFWFRAEDPKNAEIVRFDRDLRTPAVPLQGAARFGAMPMYGVIGNISLLLGGIMLLCGLVPSNPGSPASINVVAGVILIAIGWLLRRVSSRHASAVDAAGERDPVTATPDPEVPANKA